MKHRIVYIEWADAMANYDAWRSLEEAKAWASTDEWIVKQVGYVLEENDKYLLLSGSMSNDSETHDVQYSMVFKIPKPWIRHIEDIEIKNRN